MMVSFYEMILAILTSIDPIPQSPVFSPRRRLNILYEPEANIPVFHYSAPACSWFHGLDDCLGPCPEDKVF